MKILLDAIYDALAGNTYITANVGSDNIFNGVIPPGIFTADQVNAISFQWSGGGDENDTDSEDLDMLYLIQGISTKSTNEAELIGDQIFTAFHKVTLTVAGYNNIWTRVTRHFQSDLPDERTGQLRYSRGRFVRIRLAKS